MLELKQEIMSLMKNSDCKVYSGQDFEIQTEMEDLRYEMNDISFEAEAFWGEFEQVSETIWATKIASVATLSPTNIVPFISQIPLLIGLSNSIFKINVSPGTTFSLNLQLSILRK
jgi:hypothetical protein